MYTAHSEKPSGKFRHGVPKFDPIPFHIKLNDVTADLASKTVPIVVLKIDAKTLTVIVVKGAKPLVACSGALERDVSGDDFVYVDRSLDFEYRFVGDQRHTPLPRE